MKILFLTHYYPPEVNAPASRTYEHCVRWARAGHEVTVLTCAPNCPDGVLFPGYRNRCWPQTGLVDGIRIVRVWTYLAPNAGTTRRIANYVSYLVSAVLAALLLRRPDVIVATSPQFFCGWAGVFVSWLKWRPLVLEIRDIWPESIRAVGALQNRRLLRTLEMLEKWMYRAATQIVAVGGGYRDEILKKADVGERIAVITNGVDLERFCASAVSRGQAPEVGARRSEVADQALHDAIGPAFSVPPGRFVCSYVGTIGMAHGLEVVVRAARILKDGGRDDVVFLIVGDGARRAGLAEEARQAGVEDRVLFTGRQPKERMPAILAASNACLVHLRGCELFGTVIPSKIFEVMAMQRPIIMGVRGEAREIVLQAGAGLAMEPDSPESLVHCLEQLAENPTLAVELGRAGREFVTRHYDRDELAARYLSLLQRVAGR